MHCGGSRARNPERHSSHAMIDAPTRSVAAGNTGAGDSARADERLTARALAGCPRSAEIRMGTYAGIGMTDPYARPIAVCPRTIHERLAVGSRQDVTRRVYRCIPLRTTHSRIPGPREGGPQRGSSRVRRTRRTAACEHRLHRRSLLPEHRVRNLTPVAEWPPPAPRSVGHCGQCGRRTSTHGCRDRLVAAASHDDRCNCTEHDICRRRAAPST